MFRRPVHHSFRQLLLLTWVAPEEKSYDRYGNEIVPVPDKLVRWENKAVKDASYRYSQPLDTVINFPPSAFSDA